MKPSIYLQLICSPRFNCSRTEKCNAYEVTFDKVDFGLFKGKNLKIHLN